MRRSYLVGIVVLGLAATWLFPLPAQADLEWSLIEQTLPHLCGSESESEEAKAAAHKQEGCISIAEAACEAKPLGPEQALLHSEGCEIVQENASRRRTASAESSSGSDTGLIIGLIAAAVVLVSAAWVALDSRKRDLSHAWGPKHPVARVLAVVLLWPIFFPLYLVQRRRAVVRDAPQ
jgi:hypothetical protein